MLTHTERNHTTMTTIRAISTGLVKVRLTQMAARTTGPARMAHVLLDNEWSGWLPIYVWVIDHPDGIILVDSGETSRVHERGYHPEWHPFYRRASTFSVHPEEELGPQLRALGIGPRDVRQVVLTHLHTDHAGGLTHLTGAKTWVTQDDYNNAQGLKGKLFGYLPHRWPKWWQPEFIRFQNTPLGPFAQSMPLTRDGEVVVVPTPGHTPNHVSVVVRGSTSYFLAGDTSYTQQLLIDGKVDGVSPDERVTRETARKILAFAKERPLVYLPSHDPEGAERLRTKSVLPAGRAP